MYHLSLNWGTDYEDYLTWILSRFAIWDGNNWTLVVGVLGYNNAKELSVTSNYNWNRKPLQIINESKNKKKKEKKERKK